MLIADIALRGAAGALLAVVALLLLRDARGTWPGRLGAALSVGAMAYLLCSVPEFLDWPAPISLPLLLFCLGNPVLFWMFARSLFDDDYRPGQTDATVLAVILACGLGRVFGQALLPTWLDLATASLYQAGVLGLVLHALWHAVRGRSVDLIEERRQFRMVFVAGIGGYIGLITTVEVFLHIAPPPQWLLTLNPAAIAVLTCLILVRVVRLRHDDLVGVLLLPQAPAATISTADKALLGRLEKAMTEEHAYREEGLGIAAFAERLAIPEYRLRRLINQQLGFRNFPAFVNSYRIEEAKAALSDPSRDRDSIMTIALELGFASIGPFNRAFKLTTGVTPRQFRQRIAANDAKPTSG